MRVCLPGAGVDPVCDPPAHQVAKRVSSIAPARSSMISSPLRRVSQTDAGQRCPTGNIAFSSRTAAGKYSHAAERVGWLDSTGQWRHGSRSCAERDDLSAYSFAMSRRPTRKYSATCNCSS